MAKKQAAPDGEPDDTDIVDLEPVEAGEQDNAEQADTAPQTIEDFARARGWKPKDEWSGDGEWRDASQFLEFGLDRGRDASRDLKELRETTARIADTQTRIMAENVERVRQEERAKWQRLHDQAVEEGNTEIAGQAVEKLTQLAQPAVPQRDYAAEFARDNPWFGSDPEAKALAIAVAEKFRNSPPDVQFEEARKAVHKRFPEYAPQSDTPAKVIEVGEPATRARETRKGKTFHDLPAEAQQAARLLVSRGLLKSTDGYVQQYFNKEGTVG